MKTSLIALSIFIIASITSTLIVTSCQQVVGSLVLADYVVRDQLNIPQRTEKRTSKDIFVVEEINGRPSKMFYLVNNSKELKNYILEKSKEDCQIVWSQGVDSQILTIKYASR